MDVFTFTAATPSFRVLAPSTIRSAMIFTLTGDLVLCNLVLAGHINAICCPSMRESAQMTEVEEGSAHLILLATK